MQKTELPEGDIFHKGKIDEVFGSDLLDDKNSQPAFAAFHT